MSIVRYALLAPPLAALALGAAACGQDVDDSKLEGRIRDDVRARGAKVESVDCPAGEKVEKGNRFTCTLRTTRGKSVPIRVRITSGEDGGRAVFLIPAEILPDQGKGR